MREVKNKKRESETKNVENLKYKEQILYLEIKNVESKKANKEERRIRVRN